MNVKGYVYIMANKSGAIYIGVTSDLVKRVSLVIPSEVEGGHQSIKTTEIHTHVASSALVNVKSPL